MQDLKLLWMLVELSGDSLQINQAWRAVHILQRCLLPHIVKMLFRIAVKGGGRSTRGGSNIRDRLEEEAHKIGRPRSSLKRRMAQKLPLQGCKKAQYAGDRAHSFPTWRDCEVYHVHCKLLKNTKRLRHKFVSRVPPERLLWNT